MPRPVELHDIKKKTGKKIPDRGRSFLDKKAGSMGSEPTSLHSDKKMVTGLL